jgi:hypothetical protein
MALLRQTVTEVVASDAPPLQKASAVARLGALYLKAQRTTELERANKRLKRQVAAMEERVAELERPVRSERPHRRAENAFESLSAAREAVGDLVYAESSSASLVAAAARTPSPELEIQSTGHELAGIGASYAPDE